MWMEDAMKSFVAEKRTINDGVTHPFELVMAVNFEHRIPRKTKKTIKSMSKRVSTMSILEELSERR